MLEWFIVYIAWKFCDALFNVILQAVYFIVGCFAGNPETKPKEQEQEQEHVSRYRKLHDYFQSKK